tara:strand:- start:570 stop:806 length:237 start_codon:yes stop_codon:yes gene_type:complete
MGYGMFSKNGDKAAQSVVNKILKLPLSTTNKELYKVLTTEMNKVADDKGHEEIWDTECREQIISTIEDKTKRNLTIYF